MSSKDEILLEFEAVVRVKKDGTVEMKPKDKDEKRTTLKQSEIPVESKAFATSSSGFYCINGQWHWCFDDGVGGGHCDPLGVPC